MSNEEDKETHFYAATVAAWYSTRLEHDKSLITLSTGGIGLLVTLLTTVGVTSVENFILYILALVSFIICVGAVLWIFKQNAPYLQEVLRKDKHVDPILVVLDSVAKISFAFGVVFAAVIGISQAANSLPSKENAMSQKGRMSVKDSFSGATLMKPDTGDSTRSFTGAGELKPAPAPAQSGTSQTAGGGTAQGQSQGQGTSSNQGSAEKK